MSQEQSGNQPGKLIELDAAIGRLIKEAGVTTAVIIIENPSPTNDSDKLLVHLSGHHYDAAHICCVVASNLRAQIVAELGGQS